MLDKEFLRQHLLALGMTSSLHDFTLDDDIRCEVAERYFTLTKITGQPFLIPTEGAHGRVHHQIARLVC